MNEAKPKPTPSDSASSMTPLVAIVAIILASAIGALALQAHRHGEVWFENAVFEKDETTLRVLMALRPGLLTDEIIGKEMRRNNEWFVSLFLGKIAKRHEQLLMRWAAFNGYADAIKRLLAKGVDPNSGECLVYASYATHPVIVKTLLDAGADPNLKSKKYSYLEGVMPYLSRDLEGFYPLSKASDREIIKLLVEHGANINFGDDKNRNPLHFKMILDIGTECIPGDIGFSKAHIDSAELLMDLGSDPNSVDCENRTPLHFFAISFSGTSARFFRKYNYIDGEFVVQDNNEIGIPSEFLAPYDNGIEFLEMLTLLLKRGADPDLKNNAGKTPAESIDEGPARDLFLAMIAEARAILAAEQQA